MTLTEFVLSYQAALTVLGCYVLTRGLRKTLPEVANHPLGRRLSPMVPGVFGLALGLVPGWLPGEGSSRVALGVLLGLCAPALHGLIKSRTGVDVAANSPAPAAPVEEDEAD